MLTAASVGPYKLCNPAPLTAVKPRAVSTGNASPITNTCRNEDNASSATADTNTVNIDGTKSVTVT
ncbi:hypothetical protein MLGJGCBP_03141 [Rhodococcus sp. T7]|nr:hypothetical protein MLGJGCBP_10187 [Rhodococcus sp. T7]KAF0963729.1 hypothetical protein MLGJGCBP_03141 [Rhodococcus sp. T7]